ncbi:hypothetical protein DPMN_188104 [Dreissena polymorpha]|uniref:C17orf113 probable zinc finger domain-containing protein n=1 Tax=Dreissena polymorpha TaxID=45954 RepID=A0A9D4DPI0_DREPO|nr:hypothetical protein DPMN_188104 [Dreissena polymorpha]
MSKRGRKTSAIVSQKSQSIANFFERKQGTISVESFVVSILLETVNAAVDFTSKKHDGKSVTENTCQKWKKAFPWLTIVDIDGEVNRLKCAYCTQFNLKNVWSAEGTPYIQRSSVERHNESKDHVSAAKLFLSRNLDISIETECNETETYDGNVSEQDVFLLRTIYSLAKNEIPSERVNDMLELQTLNEVDIKYQNLIWTTINDIQQCISTVTEVKQQ